MNIAKVGHAGTLDPFATGLLILLLGKSTRLQNEFMKMDKVYTATFSFAKETDTLDPTGETTVADEDIKGEKLNLTREIIESIIDQNFVGPIKQIPPKYSAKKTNGKRAYELARKGIDTVLPPKSVIIRNFKLLEIDAEALTIDVELLVSSGTYIRAIARDLAKKMGRVAHVTKLKRTAIGPFSVEQAMVYDDTFKPKLQDKAKQFFDVVKDVKDCLPGETWVMNRNKTHLLLTSKDRGSYEIFKPYFGNNTTLKIICEDHLCAVLKHENFEDDSSDDEYKCLYFDESILKRGGRVPNKFRSNNGRSQNKKNWKTLKQW